MYKGKFQSPAKGNTATKKRERQPKKIKEKQIPASGEAPKKSRKVKVSTIVFYSVLGTFILAFCIGLVIAKNALNDYLVRYEAAQHYVKCESVFSELFHNPDWAKIYEFAPGDFTAEEYAQYMEQKVGDQELTCIETSAGSSNEKKYIVRCGTEKIATFTLTNLAPEADIPDWQLGKVEIFYQAELSVYILAPMDDTVLVNGQALDNSNIIRTITTEAQAYLPEGVYGYRMKELAVHNLLIEPEVQVLDPQGNPVELQYDNQNRRYSVEIKAPEITEEHRQALVTAGETYCKFMIRRATKNDLSKCFDPNSDLYLRINESDSWMRSFAKYELSEAAISNYYCYNDTYFSGQITMTLKVTKWDLTVQEYPLNSTFFVKKEGEQWLVWEWVDSDVQAHIIQEAEPMPPVQ